MGNSAESGFKDAYRSHLEGLLAKLSSFMERKGYQELIIDSGVPGLYYEDDQHISFKSNPYFKYFCPLEGERHLLLLSPGQKPKLFVFEPQSFWSDIHYDVDGSYWAESFDISYLRSPHERIDFFKTKKATAYLGPHFTKLPEFGLLENPKDLLVAMNWWRSQKSAYEILCLRIANKRGALAHQKVEEGFRAKKSEYELHMDYMSVLQETEHDMPYENIIAYNEKAAILHYRAKRAQSKKDVLLIDAGASYCSYASDISRTYADESTCDPVFVDLLKDFELLQKKICLQVREGASFVDLQIQTHLALADLLLKKDILRETSSEEAFNLGLTSAFYPHSLGHMLGIQVHDVGGWQCDEDGTPCKKDERLPTARLTRALRENEVVTVEPGLYFIPFLLEEKRKSLGDKYFNSSLIDRLIPFGGIRIEDNVVVQKEGEPLNLTRAYLP